MERMNRIAKELSSLIVYCCSVNKFSLERVRSKGRIFYEMSSFPETAAEKLMCQQEPKFFIWYHQVSNIIENECHDQIGSIIMQQ